MYRFLLVGLIMDGEVGDIKKKLKQWEYFFTKCHQRKPARVSVYTQS